MSYQGLKPSLINLALDSSTDAATGSGVTLSVLTSYTVRLTNASLVSVAGIPAMRDGEEIVLQNDTGVALLISNESGSATAANRILTGIGVDALLRDEQSVNLIYSTSASRWRVVGYIEAI